MGHKAGAKESPLRLFSETSGQGLSMESRAGAMAGSGTAPDTARDEPGPGAL